MRILYLTPGVFDKGGISRYNRYQINALREIYGARSIRVLSLQGPEPGGFETPFDVFWHGRNGVATSLDRAGFSVQSIRNALLWKPEAILCAHVNFTPLVTQLGLLSGAQTILNVYGLELWKNLSERRQDHMARMDHVISDCHATAEHVEAHDMHDAAPEVIWDCVDLDRFHPGPRNAAVAHKYGIPFHLDTPIVLSLGRLAEAARHKGFDRLLEIWGIVGAQIPKAQLVIAGDGDDAGRLKEKALGLGLSGAVTFTGSVDEADLPGLYRLADLFCLVSDKGPGRGEGIPLTPLEAMASGVPVIVGDEDGSREAVVGTHNGRVVSPRDPEALAQTIISLLSAPTHEQRKLSKAARSVAQQRFGYAAFRDKHRDLLTKLRA